jgi:regulation of enolase protein 1 (concanavalin A-like superfamily)
MYLKLQKSISKSRYENIENGIKAFATPGSDYYVNPETDEVIANAPFFYQDISGDFMLRSRVSLDFKSTFDACVLLALEDDRHWAKACFEMSDMGSFQIVSVMTNGRSDDANCVSITQNEVWLQLARKENVFSVHYSLDGKNYLMARITHIPMKRTIKVGFEAQSPFGNGGERYFRDIEWKQTTLHDIRGGNQ